MIYSPQGHKETSGIYIKDNTGSFRTISTVYGFFHGKLRVLWELILGYLFDSENYTLMDSDGYILKASDQ